MNPSNKNYLVAICACTVLGPVRVKLLLEYFKSPRLVWDASPRDLKKINLGEKSIKAFLKHREEFDFKKYFGKLNDLGVNVVSVFEDSYPQNLKVINGAPVVLYIKGKIKKNDLDAIAVVGSRKMTSYGQFVTERFVNELVSSSITIVSGLAYGIDSAAHRSALAAGGRTIGVIGSGIDNIYPVGHTQLADEIVQRGLGAIVTEYPLGYPALPVNFPSRNRIISGISKGVIIVEAKIQSGTIHTAMHAMEQGRAVFAVPGPINSPLSEAPHYLISNGAYLLTDTKQILEELSLQFLVDRDEVEKLMPEDELEEKIYKILERSAASVDYISRELNKTVAIISGKLITMEIKGMVKDLGNGEYQLL